MSMVIRLFTCGILLFSILGCGIGKRPARFEPVRIDVAGSYLHKESKMVFPDRFGNLIRTEITQFDQNGTDIGVGYSGKNLPLVITVFVYPAPDLYSIGSPQEVVDHAREVLFQNHYEGLKGDVLRANASAVLQTDGEFELAQANETYTGKLAKYKLNYRFSLGERPSASSLYLFQVGKWLVSYRVTYPETFAAEFEPIVRSIMQGLKFPSEKT
jgi:hypothetical protein